MRRVFFDYPNTCSVIDSAISDAKQEIESFIDDLLSDACGLLPQTKRKELAKDFTDTLYRRLEDVFEDTRRSNENMRDAADSQIEDLQDKIASLEIELEG